MEKDDPLIPEWLRQEQEQRELENLQDAARKAQDRAAFLLIEQKAPLFRTRVLARLEASVKALPMTVEMTGSVNRVGTGFRVCVNKLGPIANYTHTDLFFEPLKIRCNFHEGSSEDLRFCVLSGSEVRVIDGVGPMSEEETGDYIMQRMVNLIKRRY
jgi:hypothetical protein